MFIGLKHPVAAAYSDGNGTPTYSNGFVMGAGISVKPATEVKDNPFYADNDVYIDDKGIKGGTISEEITHMSEQNYATLFGHTYTAAVPAEGSTPASPAHITIGENDDPIYVGHGYIVTRKYKNSSGTVVKDFVVVWYKKVKFSEPSEEAKTKEADEEYTSVAFDGKFERASDGNFGDKYFFTDEDDAVAFLDGLAGISSGGSGGNDDD